MVILCIDFGGTEVKLGLFDDGRLSTSREVAALHAADALSPVATAARALAGGSAIEAVAIAMPGIVEDGRILRATPGKYPFAVGADVAAWAEREFGAPAIVENDARAALRGELAAGGVAAGETDVALMTLGTGIGTALAVDGVVLRGDSGHAGILGGHLCVALEGPPCPCGSRGCAERVANGEVARRYAGGYRQLFTRLPDPQARGLRDVSVQAWGAVAAALVQTAEARVLVLAGGVLSAGSGVESDIARAMRERMWPSMPAPDVRVGADPLRAVLRGLCTLASTDPERPAR